MLSKQDLNQLRNNDIYDWHLDLLFHKLKITS